MNITKIVVKNFRSFDKEGIELVSPDKINLLIGKNNCGKSNVLRFLNLLGSRELHNSFNNFDYGVERGFSELPITVDDHRNYSEKTPFQFSVYLEPSKNLKDLTLDKINLDKIYVTYELWKTNNGYSLKSIDSFVSQISENEIRIFEEANMRLRGGSSGGTIVQARERVARTLRVTSEVVFPRVEYLSEFRKPTENKPLRVKLNEIVNPDYRHQENLKKKELLCSYFKNVFDFEVDVKIPDLDKEIELTINGKQTPLSSLGSGLQEIVLIAFTIVTTDAEIICIDEPELHLHPGAQRELLYLASEIKDKVFFFATHSNHFLDYEVPNKKVYQLTKDGDHTKISLASTQENYIDVLDDLGIRASEIYQTNGIIWVEGPSDRVYIKKWIELLEPDFKEGLQYTFQYYGGKILSHYSLDDYDFKEYLNVLNVNKNAFVVMDSDMSKAYSITDLRQTKQRIITECESNNIGYWVTKGKEIENYLTNSVLTAYLGVAVKRNIHRSIRSYCSSYDATSKVSFSREIVELISIKDVKENGDLEEKIREIIEAIRSWNK